MACRESGQGRTHGLLVVRTGPYTWHAGGQDRAVHMACWGSGQSRYTWHAGGSGLDCTLDMWSQDRTVHVAWWEINISMVLPDVWKLLAHITCS